MIPIKNRRPHPPALCLSLLLTALFCWQNAGAEPLDKKVFASRAESAWRAARADYQSATNGSPAAWRFARACYNLADFATNEQQRADLAKQGIDACHQLLASQPQSGPALYYLGMNQGQLARTKLLGALKLVREMEHNFKTAWTLDPQVDHGGPARSLGLLYREAPAWPLSVGGKYKARQWLDRAVQFDPVFPENLLVLCESDLRWDEVPAVAEKLKQLDAVWPRAQTNFTGAAWSADWADWTARRNSLRAKIAEKQDADNDSAKSSRRSD